MDTLSVIVGVVAPIAVVIIILVAVRAIIRADRREDEAIGAMDAGAESDEEGEAPRRTTPMDREGQAPPSRQRRGPSDKRSTDH
jgi:hypothetical protein